MLLICYPRCTTCKKAQKWLSDRGISYEYRDIKVQNPTASELSGWHQRSGLPLRRFFNTSGIQYRALGLKDKLGSMTEEEQFEILASDGLLVKRPLVVSEDLVLVGFNEREWESRLARA